MLGTVLELGRLLKKPFRKVTLPMECSKGLPLAVTGTFCATFAVYIKCLHPSLPGGDSGELVVAAHELGVAHPPGYPLFTLLAKLFLTVIPVGSVAWRVNLLSALCGALCSSVIYLLVYRLTVSHSASLLGAGIFSFSRLVWTWSVSAEVFALNNLLVVVLMLIAVIFDGGPKESLVKLSVSGSLLCGLCLSNQHTSVLYVAVIVPWALYRLWKNQLLTVSVLLKLTVAFLCGLLPYIYLPISSLLHMARWTWGDQSTVRGFLTHLFRTEYGTWDLLKDHSGQGFYAGLLSYLWHTITDLSLAVPVLAALSIFSIYSRSRYQKNSGGVLTVFSLMLLIYVSFFCWRANLDIENPLFFRVVERFWMQSDVVVIVLACVAFADACGYVGDRLQVDKYSFDIALVIPLVALHICQWWPVCDHSRNLVIRDFALQSLQSFPPGSLVLTKGDLPSNSFRYLHLCENVRPDLTVFDQEVLTYEWSLPMTREFYPKIKFPGDLLQPYTGMRKDGKKAFRFKDLIDANYDSQQIFACIGVQEHEPSWTENYTLWPYGVCWQMVKKNTKLDINQWTNTTAHLADQWVQPWSEVHDGSWEYVANSEMWRARTATAYFYLELALELGEGQKESKHLLLQSYQLYTEAIEHHKVYPAYWDRNYAIVCERLTRAGTSLDQLMLLQKTVFHFGEFIRREPDDADAHKIAAAISTLENYIKSLKKP